MTLESNVKVKYVEKSALLLVTLTPPSFLMEDVHI